MAVAHQYDIRFATLLFKSFQCIFLGFKQAQRPDFTCKMMAQTLDENRQVHEPEIEHKGQSGSPSIRNSDKYIQQGIANASSISRRNGPAGMAQATFPCAGCGLYRLCMVMDLMNKIAAAMILEKDGRSTFIVHDTATATSRHPQLSGVAAMEGLLVRNDRPRRLRPAAGLCAGRQRDARRAAQVSAASGASRSQRAEHAPVPLVRRDPAPIPACHGRQRGCAPGGTCLPHPAHRHRREPGTSSGRSRDADFPRTATAGGGMCAGRPKRVPHLAHLDRHEPSTSPCRSRDATAPACHGR